MTKYLSAIVLVATIVVAACSGGGSGAGAPTPVTTSAWAISSFTASDTNPYVGSVVAVSVSATADGAPVPDGTTITISAAYSGNELDPEFGLGTIGSTVNRLASSNGTVTASFVANTEGPYSLSARVGTATSSLVVTYRDREISNTLQIFQPLLPNIGSLNGGEQVTLNGKAIVAPVEVDFEVNGQVYPGIVVGGTPSEPPSSVGQIIVRTPYISGLTAEERLLDWTSTVTVRVGVNTGDTQEEVLPGAFTFLRAPEPPAGPTTWLGNPAIYLVIPDHGQSAGGQQVTILGTNFRGRVTDPDGTVTEEPVAVDTVTFGDVEAIVLSVSADGKQIVAQTPRWTNIPLDEDVPVDVTVNTSFDTYGPFTATQTGGFVYLADEPTPEITALAPTGGPIDGGEQVTIFGHGFQAPAQVTFGNLEAINVQVNDDQSLSDQDTIILVTPDYSQQNEQPPVAVDVVVRNILSGKTSDPVTYTYGDNLYISGNTPDEGGPGDNIIIYGAGFEAPLQVELGGMALDVLSVSGTEILVRIPVDAQPSCSNVSSAFKVTLLESGLETTGGGFTFLGSNPQIFGVDPIFVQETAGGDGVSPFEIIITGEYFNSNLIVEVGGFRIANNEINVLDNGTIEVLHIPAPNDFGIDWDESPCVTDIGLLGVQKTATPVDVTVINLPGNCSDTLAGGLVYEPEQPVECFVAPEINVLPLLFEATPANSCSSGQPLTIQNLGQGSLDVQQLSLQGPFYFDNFPNSQSAGPLAPIDPFDSNTTLNVFFCPTLDDGLLQQGGLIIVSNDPNSPTTIDLSGQEAFPIMAVAPQNLNFGTIPGDLIFTISNNGTDDLTWSLDNTDDPDGVFSDDALGGTIQVGDPATIVTVTFTAAGAPATHAGSLLVTAAEPDALGSPVTVTLAAETP